MTLSRTLSPSLVPTIARRERTLGSQVLSAILSQWPERTRGSPPPSYLRRDIGLMPEEPRRGYWDL